MANYTLSASSPEPNNAPFSVNIGDVANYLLVNGPVEISFSDGGAGGSFDRNPIGASGSDSVNYTPANGFVGVVTISTSNTNGAVDPPPINVTITAPPSDYDLSASSPHSKNTTFLLAITDPNSDNVFGDGTGITFSDGALGGIFTDGNTSGGDGYITSFINEGNTLGGVDYTPPLNYTGAITFTVTNNSGLTDPQPITVQIVASVSLQRRAGLGLKLGVGI